MSERLQVLIQHLLPKRSLTEIAGRVARTEGGSFTTKLIQWFVRKYGVDMSEAANPNVDSYGSFNEFFTRPLRPDARPLADADFVSPVDGAISQLGSIDDHHILQAKGHRFTTVELLGGDAELATKFRHGSFANLYLSPRDYHRLHMPCDGELVRMIYVPGSLFSVNPVTARSVPNLFARNERVVCVFESPRHGSFVAVLVGATIVGSIATVWHGVVNPKRTGRVAEWTYVDQSVSLRQGEEFGRFLLGSTIVMLFGPGTISFDEGWVPERSVRLGEKMENRRGDHRRLLVPNLSALRRKTLRVGEPLDLHRELLPLRATRRNLNRVFPLPLGPAHGTIRCLNDRVITGHLRLLAAWERSQAAVPLSNEG